MKNDKNMTKVDENNSCNQNVQKDENTHDIYLKTNQIKIFMKILLKKIYLQKKNKV
ncbi:hypothetical protein [Wigglesworthia glossinidia]|uniref:hypothetical protein n=1 Tax=Wigglesworthia glossinidia TaxID=51229 RepID=UPI0002F0648F|nr:hypothetical protein [Wigglesworthia glossinidia]